MVSKKQDLPGPCFLCFGGEVGRMSIAGMSGHMVNPLRQKDPEEEKMGDA